MLKNLCFWTVVLEKTLENPLDCKEIKPVNPKGNQSWIFIGRTDAETETPILWPPDAKSWLTGKDPDTGKDWRQERRDDRGWDGWMASPTQWTWAWAGSGSWWWTGKPGMLQSMGSQRVRHDRATELNWSDHGWAMCKSLLPGHRKREPLLKRGRGSWEGDSEQRVLEELRVRRIVAFHWLAVSPCQARRGVCLLPVGLCLHRAWEPSGLPTQF